MEMKKSHRNFRWDLQKTGRSPGDMFERCYRL